MEAKEVHTVLEAVIAHLLAALEILDEHRTGEIAAAHIIYAVDLLTEPPVSTPLIESQGQRQLTAG